MRNMVNLTLLQKITLKLQGRVFHNDTSVEIPILMWKKLRITVICGILTSIN